MCIIGKWNTYIVVMGDHGWLFWVFTTQKYFNKILMKPQLTTSNLYSRTVFAGSTSIYLYTYYTRIAYLRLTVKYKS